MGLHKRYIQIAGSTKETVDRDLLAKSHAAVRSIVTGILKAGGGLIVGAGEDARLDESDPNTARLFDWTVLDEVERFSGGINLIQSGPGQRSTRPAETTTAAAGY